MGNRRNKHGFHGSTLWKRNNKGYRFSVVATKSEDHYAPFGLDFESPKLKEIGWVDNRAKFFKVPSNALYAGVVIMRKITIELKVDFAEDSENLKLAIDMAKDKAKELYASMMLIAGRRHPQIVVRSGDYFSSVEDISLADAAENTDEVIR